MNKDISIPCEALDALKELVRDNQLEYTEGVELLTNDVMIVD